MYLVAFSACALFMWRFVLLIGVSPWLAYGCLLALALALHTVTYRRRIPAFQAQLAALANPSAWERYGRPAVRVAAAGADIAGHPLLALGGWALDMLSDVFGVYDDRRTGYLVHPQVVTRPCGSRGEARRALGAR